MELHALSQGFSEAFIIYVNFWSAANLRWWMKGLIVIDLAHVLPRYRGQSDRAGFAWGVVTAESAYSVVATGTWSEA